MPDLKTNKAVIEVENVTHHYGFRPVLRDVTLRIDAGELIALMGPNGMGKSTLMAIMAGVISPSRGHVSIGGQRRRQNEETEIAIRRKVVYLPADCWMPRYITGRDWLLAVGHAYGHDDLRLMEHADRLMQLFDLGNKQESLIASYSTGQIKKLALAAGLISECPIMLLDEPFSGGLDPSGITALKRVLQRLREDRKATIVMATPVPELVEELADRIAIVRGGQIVAFDSIAGLRQTSGSTGNLNQVYESLFSPHTAASVERYFKGGQP